MLVHWFTCFFLDASESLLVVVSNVEEENGSILAYSCPNQNIYPTFEVPLTLKIICEEPVELQ